MQCASHHTARMTCCSELPCTEHEASEFRVHCNAGACTGLHVQVGKKREQQRVGWRFHQRHHPPHTVATALSLPSTQSAAFHWRKESQETEQAVWHALQ